MAKQGKCVKCKIRYTWNREIRLGIAYCPKCGSFLRATSVYSQLPSQHLESVPQCDARLTRRFNEELGFKKQDLITTANRIARQIGLA